MNVCAIATGREKDLASWFGQFPPWVHVFVYCTESNGCKDIDSLLSDDLCKAANVYLLPHVQGISVGEAGFSVCRSMAWNAAEGNPAESCLSLDTDEYIRDWGELQRIEKEPSINYASANFGGHCVIRWVRDRGQFVWRGRAHEVLTPKNALMRSDPAEFGVDHRKDVTKKRNHYLSLLAADWYDSVLKVEGAPEKSRACWYFGRELYYNKMYDQAASVLAEYDRDDFPSECALCHMYRSRCFYSLGRWDDALHEARAAFIAYPSQETISHLVWLVEEHPRCIESLPRTHMQDLIKLPF